MTITEMDQSSWKQLADQKEKEWRGILESRITSLEKALKEKEGELTNEKTKLSELKEHFKYNLRLLEERDRELEKYDASFAELRTAANTKNAEISELKIHLDDLKNVIKREEKTKEELQLNYQRRLREKQAEVDNYKSCKDGELQDERKEYEDFRRTLQQHLTSVQNELDTQRRELTTEFDNELKKREHDFRIQSDQLHAKVLEHELKAKLLEKELDLTRESNEKTSAQALEVESTQRELEKLIKQKEWELADTTAMKDSVISELQTKLETSESAMKKMQEDFQRKFVEMDKLVREREEMIERAKNGYLEREASLQAANQDLQSKLEDSQIRERQLTWTNQDLVKEKEMQIEKLQGDVNDVKEKWDRHVAEISRENVNRDLEHGSALEEQRRLQLELEQRKDDLNRYKNELKMAADREEKLEKAKTQAELDWQKRCEVLESQQYEKSEDLIKKLTTARNQAQALVKERERELQHNILLVKSLHRERDGLRVLLKEHDIPLDSFVKYSIEDAEEDGYVEDLQKQNSSLRELIAQMRLDMESLGKESSNKQTGIQHGHSTELEREIKDLMRVNKELNEKLKNARNKSASHILRLEDNEEVLSQLKGNDGVRNHILALNEAIGNMRAEKVEMAATVKKQQARLAYLENSLEEMSKQPQQKQIHVDQLKYELNSQQRRHDAEVTGLNHRVKELELQLSESRREADEYHRASVERNQEVVGLNNQLSALKMEMAETNPTINFGAQELYIQQLQSELTQLRKRANALDVPDLGSLASKFDSLDEHPDRGSLKHKLRSAAAKIVQLAKENQQLMESNNKLRAELKNAALAETEPVKDDNTKPVNNVRVQQKGPEDLQADDSYGRLSQLEKLQYHLTRQELQFAHRFNEGSGADVPKPVHAYDSTKPVRSVIMPRTSNNVPSPNNPDKEYPAVGMSRDSYSHVMMSMSSGGGDSIQKVWQMLEESDHSGEPSTPCSPKSFLEAQRKGSANRPEGNGEFLLQGSKVAASPKQDKTRSERRVGREYAENVRKLARPKPKVRNYNTKDDRR